MGAILGRAHAFLQPRNPRILTAPSYWFRPGDLAITTIRIREASDGPRHGCESGLELGILELMGGRRRSDGTPKRARSRERRTQPRGVLHTAPVPDPTAPALVAGLRLPVLSCIAIHWTGMNPSLALLLTLVSAETSEDIRQPKTLHVAAFERIFVDAGCLVAFPSGGLSGPFGDVHPGVALHFDVGLRKVPLAFGIGFHETSLSGAEYVSSDTGIYSINGNIGVGRLYISQSAALRHFDAFLRLEPDWKRVRPYLELLGGTSQIFVTSKVSDSIGNRLESEETNGNLTWEWGYGAGIRFEPLAPWGFPSGSLSLVVSLGLRRVQAGSLRYLQTRPGMVGGQPGLDLTTGETSYAGSKATKSLKATWSETQAPADPTPG